MSLTGPELDLLLELLQDSPSAEVYRSVVQSLLETSEPHRALEVLSAAYEEGADDIEDAALLAKLAVEQEKPERLGLAFKVLGVPDDGADVSLQRAYAIWLDHRGDLTQAGDLARKLLQSAPDDLLLRAILARADADDPDPAMRGVDPWYTVGRAEAYADVGRMDLAVRTLRRVLAAHPQDAGVMARLTQLRAQAASGRPWVDDLSEEYWLARAAPPLTMPAPGLTSAVLASSVGAPPREATPASLAEDEDAATGTITAAKRAELLSVSPAPRRVSVPKRLGED